jgi:hypothetical protein
MVTLGSKGGSTQKSLVVIWGISCLDTLTYQCIIESFETQI